MSRTNGGKQRMFIPGRQPAHPVDDDVATGRRAFAVTRRDLLLFASSCLASTPWLEAAAQDAATPDVGLADFMRMCRVLTGFDDLADETAGRSYFEALRSRPNGALGLAELWRLGGFDGPDAPASIDDLAARGVYDSPALAEVADTITRNWYSGTYLAPTGEQRVATYTDALAWRTLGYRPAGPSACGGAFGHWAQRPLGA
jgi:hypothetical protein